MSEEERKCDALIRGLGGSLTAFSVGKRAQVSHVPDRRYRLRREAIWAEIKSKTDKLTQKQIDFLQAEYDCGQIVFAGDEVALRAMVLSLPSLWRDIGYRFFQQILTRGLRKVR